MIQQPDNLKFLIVTTLLALILSCQDNQPYDRNYVYLESEGVDFGTVSKSKSIQQELVIKNLGFKKAINCRFKGVETPLKLTNHCSSILPGGECVSWIGLKIEEIGRFRQILRVQCYNEDDSFGKDKGRTQIDIPIKANVHEQKMDVQLTKDEIDFGILYPEQTRTIGTILKGTGSYNDFLFYLNERLLNNGSTQFDRINSDMDAGLRCQDRPFRKLECQIYFKITSENVGGYEQYIDFVIKSRNEEVMFKKKLKIFYTIRDNYARLISISHPHRMISFGKIDYDQESKIKVKLMNQGNVPLIGCRFRFVPENNIFAFDQVFPSTIKGGAEIARNLVLDSSKDFEPSYAVGIFQTKCLDQSEWRDLFYISAEVGKVMTPPLLVASEFSDNDLGLHEHQSTDEGFWNYFIMNKGELPARNCRFLISDNMANDFFLLQSFCPDSISGGESCRIMIRGLYHSIGLIESDLVGLCDNFNEIILGKVKLDVRPVAVPRIALFREFVDFGLISPDDVKSETLNLKNSSKMDIHNCFYFLEGDIDYFSLPKNDCQKINSGGECSYAVLAGSIKRKLKINDKHYYANLYAKCDEMPKQQITHLSFKVSNY